MTDMYTKDAAKLQSSTKHNTISATFAEYEIFYHIIKTSVL